jgi:hypothetical protein
VDVHVCLYYAYMKTGRRMTESSSRILDAYVSGLRNEVERLSLMREQSDDSLMLAQLDFQIELKLQLIDDVSKCLDNDEYNDPVLTDCDSRVVIPTSRVSIA